MMPPGSVLPPSPGTVRILDALLCIPTPPGFAACCIDGTSPTTPFASFLSMNIGFFPSRSRSLNSASGFSSSPTHRSWSPYTIYNAYCRQSAWILYFRSAAGRTFQHGSSRATRKDLKIWTLGSSAPPSAEPVASRRWRDRAPELDWGGTEADSSREGTRVEALERLERLGLFSRADLGCSPMWF